MIIPFLDLSYTLQPSIGRKGYRSGGMTPKLSVRAHSQVYYHCFIGKSTIIMAYFQRKPVAFRLRAENWLFLMAPHGLETCLYYLLRIRVFMRRL